MRRVFSYKVESEWAVPWALKREDAAWPTQFAATSFGEGNERDSKRQVIDNEEPGETPQKVKKSVFMAGRAINNIDRLADEFRKRELRREPQVSTGVAPQGIGLLSRLVTSSRAIDTTTTVEPPPRRVLTERNMESEPRKRERIMSLWLDSHLRLKQKASRLEENKKRREKIVRAKAKEQGEDEASNVEEEEEAPTGLRQIQQCSVMMSFLEFVINQQLARVVVRSVDGVRMIQSVDSTRSRFIDDSKEHVTLRVVLRKWFEAARRSRLLREGAPGVPAEGTTSLLLGLPPKKKKPVVVKDEDDDDSEDSDDSDDETEEGSAKGGLDLAANLARLLMEHRRSMARVATRIVNNKPVVKEEEEVVDSDEPFLAYNRKDPFGHLISTENRDRMLRESFFAPPTTAPPSTVQEEAAPEPEEAAEAAPVVAKVPVDGRPTLPRLMCAKTLRAGKISSWRRGHASLEEEDDATMAMMTMMSNACDESSLLAVGPFSTTLKPRPPQREKKSPYFATSPLAKPRPMTTPTSPSSRLDPFLPQPEKALRRQRRHPDNCYADSDGTSFGAARKPAPLKKPPSSRQRRGPRDSRDLTAMIDKVARDLKILS